MKKILILTVLGFTTISFAKEMDKERFEKRKAKTIAMADMRIASLNNLKTCVSSSSDKDSLKKCQESHREKMKSEMKARKEMRKKRKEMRKEKQQ